MAVYYKFKSAKDFDSITIDGHFITVAILKEKIFEIKHLGRGTDFDLLVTNAQTNEEYLDEATLIPKNTSVLVRRVPGRPRMTIVTKPEEKKFEENKVDNDQSAKSTFPVASSSARVLEETEWDDDFGNDLYAIPEVPPVFPNNPVLDAPPPNKADEDSKIKALVDTPALDWLSQTQVGFGAGRGFGRGMGGRMMGTGRGFGQGGFEQKTPPPGYTCHRCKVPGHFIQHCPTNGDPNYDVRRVKPPTGIPKSMLMATPDGSYALPSGAVAVLKPNEAAFEKEIEGLPSTTRSVTDLPPELRCPLCKEVMKNAVLTSKCCFKSFCDKCIRDYIISKSSCICGAKNVLADDLLPNKTLRDTINRILESNNGSAENAGSMLQIQDMESARSAPPIVLSPTVSATSKGEPIAPLRNDEGRGIEETAGIGKHDTSALHQSLEIAKATKVADVSQAKQEPMSTKEPMPQGNARVAEDEAQQKLPACEPVKKKKKKKVLPVNAADLQWGMSQELVAENYMMPFAPSTCNPYWSGMQQLGGMDGYMAPYMGTMPYMGGYVPGPFDVPLGGVNMIPQDPFGGQGYMMPVVPPQRDLSEFAKGSNQALPVMSREEFEARKADLRRKREMEHRGESFRDRESGREMSSNGDVSTMKSKSHQQLQHQQRPMPLPPISAADQHNHRHQQHRSERPMSPPERSRREFEPVRLGKRRLEPEPEPEPEPEEDLALADRRHKASVFSRINFPEKKRKSSTNSSFTDPPPPSTAPPSSSTSHHHRHHHHHRSSSSSNGGHHHHQRHRDEMIKAPPIAIAAAAAAAEEPPISSSSSSTRKSYIPAVEQDSSDEERHFKRRRRPSRYHEEERQGHSKHR